MGTCWRGSRGASEAGASQLWSQAEGAGVAQPGEEKAVGRPYSGLSIYKRSLYERQAFYQGLQGQA